VSVSIMFPNDMQIFTVQLYLLAILKWDSGTAPSLALTTRLIRPFAVMFSGSLGLKNTRAKVLLDSDTDTQYVHYLPFCACTVGNPASAWATV
jgi:hypothetical protein